MNCAIKRIMHPDWFVIHFIAGFLAKDSNVSIFIAGSEKEFSPPTTRHTHERYFSPPASFLAASNNIAGSDMALSPPAINIAGGEKSRRQRYLSLAAIFISLVARRSAIISPALYRWKYRWKYRSFVPGFSN